MARRPAAPPPKPPDWSPEKTHAALEKQLAALNDFRDRNYREVEHGENGWMLLTLNVLTHGFGEKSNNVDQFHQAKWAGEHRVNMTEGEIQRNFSKRIEAFDAMLRSSLAELDLMLPSPTPYDAAKSSSEPTKECDVLQVYSKAQFERDLPTVTSESSEMHPYSLLFLDLDKFKGINDTLGHQAGDRVLKVCAEALHRACSEKGEVYRYGGDEFCVLLPNHSLDEGLAVASRILREARAIRMPELPDGLSASIGAACIPECARDHDELLARADEAMYVSKTAGGNQVSKADSAERKASEIEPLGVKKKGEKATQYARVEEKSHDRYAEELKRIAKQVVDCEMTLEGRHVLRHLMIHEPVEVGRTLVPQIPQDRTYAQLAIAKERGIVQHREEGRGLLRTYWIINPKFREVLEDVLYEGGNN
jgi:diguanylate cyclase (GGDEF)-like protein